MSFASAICVVVIFAILVGILQLPARAIEVVDRSSACMSIVRDPTMDDADKERELQNHALRLFHLIGILGGGSILALGLPLGAVWALDFAGLVSLTSVLSILQRLDFLLGTMIVGFAVAFVFGRVVNR